VLLSTAVNVKVVPATRVMVFDPPLKLAALMPAIRSETVAAVKLDGTVRSSSCSRPSLRRRDRAAGGRPGLRPRSQRSTMSCNFMASLHVRRGLRYNENAIAPGAQTERPGDAGPVRASLGG